MKKLSLIPGMFIVIVGIAIFCWMIISFIPSKKVSASSGGSNYITKMTVSDGVTVPATASVLVLPASSGRTYAAFVNDGSNPVYLSMDGTIAVANTGLRLNATGGSYEINFDNQYVGPVYAIAGSATSALTVTANQ